MPWRPLPTYASLSARAIHGHSSLLCPTLVDWTKIGEGNLPDDLGERYLNACEVYGDTLRAEIARDYADYDSRKETVFQDKASQICSALGEFLYEMYICTHPAAFDAMQSQPTEMEPRSSVARLQPCSSVPQPQPRRT